MARNAAAADWGLVIALISLTPPHTQAAASTKRLPPAAKWAEIRASSARAASSTSSLISASSLKLDFSASWFHVSAIDYRKVL
jgi:hypothetical protein